MARVFIYTYIFKHISTSSFNSDHSEQNKSTEEAEVLPQNVIPEVLLKYYLSVSTLSDYVMLKND